MESRNFIRFVGAMLMLCIVATAFYGSQQRIESAIDDAFKQAIEQDYQHRKSYLTRNSESHLNYNVKDYALSPSADRKIGSYTLRSRSGITTYQFKDSINEEVAKRLLNQHLLERSQPLIPNQLKSFFQKQLKEKKLESPAGILYICNDIRHWSEGDSIVPKNAYSTPRQTLDITGNLKVQAWVDYNWSILFRNLDPMAYIFLILLIGVMIYIWPTRKRPTETTQTSAPDICIDMEKQEVTINGTSCTITKLDLTLLQMLHEKNGECLTRAEIKQSFWPTDDNASEKIDVHISNIRKILKDFPQYQVITVRGKGYFLQHTI